MKIGFIHNNYVRIEKVNTTEYPAGYRISKKLRDSARYRIETEYPARLI